jgi:hypothetical protein
MLVFKILSPPIKLWAFPILTKAAKSAISITFFINYILNITAGT